METFWKVSTFFVLESSWLIGMWFSGLLLSGSLLALLGWTGICTALIGFLSYIDIT